MKSVPVWVYYTALRLVVFAIPLVVLIVLGIDPFISAIVAALFGFAVSLVFLRKPRESMSSDLYAARHGESTPAPARPSRRRPSAGPTDESVEDDAVDGRA